MNIQTYLEKLQQDESIFPMDSFDKKKVVMRVPYPEQKEFTKKERIAIDFDRVIHGYSKGWLDGEVYDSPVEGAKEAIDLLKNNYEIVIFTARLSSLDHPDIRAAQKVKILKWLKDNNIYFDILTSDKPSAKFYIDDRAIRFTGNWDETLNQIKELENYS